jgi:hypothetical protein
MEKCVKNLQTATFFKNFDGFENRRKCRFGQNFHFFDRNFPKFSEIFDKKKFTSTSKISTFRLKKMSLLMLEITDFDMSGLLHSSSDACRLRYRLLKYPRGRNFDENLTFPKNVENVEKCQKMAKSGVGQKIEKWPTFGKNMANPPHKTETIYT